MYTDKLLHRELQLSSLLDYIKELEAWRLDGYDGDDVEYILHLLQHSQLDGHSRGAGGLGTSNFTAAGQQGPRSDGTTWPTAQARPSTEWNSRLGTATLRTVQEQSPNADLAHALHYASIALLGLLVIEV